MCLRDEGYTSVVRKIVAVGIEEVMSCDFMLD